MADIDDDSIRDTYVLGVQASHHCVLEEASESEGRGGSQPGRLPTTYAELRLEQLLSDHYDLRNLLLLWKELCSVHVHEALQRTGIDVESFWTRCLGCPISQYFELAGCLWIQYSPIGTDTVAADLVINPSTFFRHTVRNRETGLAVLMRFVRPGSELGAAFASSEECPSASAFSYGPFFESPMVRLPNANLIPVDRTMLLRRFCEAPFWHAFSYFQKMGKTTEFTQQFGEPFECYVRGLLKDQYGRATDGPVAAGADERADVIVKGSKYLVVVEAKAARLPLRLRTASAFDDNREFLERLLFRTERSPKGFGQILRFVKDLKENHPMSYSLPRAFKKMKFLGLVVTPDEIPLSPDLTRWIDEEIVKERGELGLEKVGIRLGVTSIHEFRELVRGSGQGVFTRCLRDWLTSVFQGEPLGYFLQFERPDVIRSARKRDSGDIDSYFDEIGLQYFGKHWIEESP